MRSHLTHAYFPYRCSPCGIVSVNIAADTPVCPRNAAHKITRISGRQTERDKPPVSRPTFLERIGFRKRPAQQDRDDHPRIICAWGDHELYDQPYECPYCRQIAMRFAETGTRFD